MHVIKVHGVTSADVYVVYTRSKFSWLAVAWVYVSDGELSHSDGFWVDVPKREKVIIPEVVVIFLVM